MNAFPIAVEDIGGKHVPRGSGNGESVIISRRQCTAMASLLAVDGPAHVEPNLVASHNKITLPIKQPINSMQSCVYALLLFCMKKEMAPATRYKEIFDFLLSFTQP
jgi:hypothetical protein